MLRAKPRHVGGEQPVSERLRARDPQPARTALVPPGKVACEAERLVLHAFGRERHARPGRCRLIHAALTSLGSWRAALMAQKSLQEAVGPDYSELLYAFLVRHDAYLLKLRRPN
jgi:hypothetical protein